MTRRTITALVPLAMTMPLLVGAPASQADHLCDTFDPLVCNALGYYGDNLDENIHLLEAYVQDLQVYEADIVQQNVDYVTVYLLGNYSEETKDYARLVIDRNTEYLGELDAYAKGPLTEWAELVETNARAYADETAAWGDGTAGWGVGVASDVVDHFVTPLVNYTDSLLGLYDEWLYIVDESDGQRIPPPPMPEPYEIDTESRPPEPPQPPPDILLPPPPPPEFPSPVMPPLPRPPPTPPPPQPRPSIPHAPAVDKSAASGAVDEAWDRARQIADGGGAVNTYSMAESPADVGCFEQPTPSVPAETLKGEDCDGDLLPNCSLLRETGTHLLNSLGQARPCDNDDDNDGIADWLEGGICHPIFTSKCLKPRVVNTDSSGRKFGDSDEDTIPDSKDLIPHNKAGTVDLSLCIRRIHQHEFMDPTASEDPDVSQNNNPGWGDPYLSGARILNGMESPSLEFDRLRPDDHVWNKRDVSVESCRSIRFISQDAKNWNFGGASIPTLNLELPLRDEDVCAHDNYPQPGSQCRRSPLPGATAEATYRLLQVVEWVYSGGPDPGFQGIKLPSQVNPSPYEIVFEFEAENVGVCQATIIEYVMETPPLDQVLPASCG